MARNHNEKVFNDFTQNIGLCLIYFGYAERALYALFTVALNSKTATLAKAIYSTPKNFGARRSLVEAAVEKTIEQAPDNERASLQSEWENVKSKMGSAFTPRNKVAHYIHYIWGTEEGPEHALQAAFFDWKDDKPPDKPITVKELKKIQNDLLAAKKGLVTFSESLASAGRKEQRQ